MPDFTVDELDRAIVHAVERSPRAPWKGIAEAVGVDAATVARRWSRLESAGLVWVTCYPLLTRQATAAIIELECTAGQVLDVASAVARDSRVQFVDVVAGRGDLLITAVESGLARLSAYAITDLPRIAGVRTVRTWPITSVYFEGGFAAHGSLDRDALAKLPSPDHGLLLRSDLKLDELDGVLCMTLSEDGRKSISAIAEETGMSPTGVRRRLARLQANGIIRMMVAAAPALTGTDTSAWITARIPAGEQDSAINKIARLPGTSAVVSIAAPENLILKCSVRGLRGVEQFEVHLSEAIPRLVVVDRKVVLRPIRALSRLVDERGGAVEVIHVERAPGAADRVPAAPGRSTRLSAGESRLRRRAPR